MSVKKRTLSLILILVLALQLLLPAAQPLYADTETTVQDRSDGLLQEGAVSTGLSGHGAAAAYLSASDDTLQSAEDAIYNGIQNMRESINLRAYQLSVDELKTCFTRVINLHPELFYVNNEYSYSYISSYVTALNPQYKYTESEITEMKATYEQEISAILSQIDSSWTDLEKIVFVNDYIAQNFEYDTTYTIRDAYSFLTEKTGVCQAYSLLFIALMNRLGISVSFAASDAMNHVWNVVQLSGEWYHVDVTWDDPTPDTIGLAHHTYLLLSDDAIQTAGSSTNKHHDWECDYTCTDTTYDSDAVWASSRTPFQYSDGAWYGTAYDAESKYACLYQYDLNAQTKTAVSTLGRWHVSGSSGWYALSAAGLDLYGGYLYLNTEDALMRFDPETGELTTITTPTEANGIWGSRVDGDTLYYQKMESYNSADGVIYSYSLADAPVKATATPSPTPVPTTAPTATAAPIATSTAAPAATAAPTVTTTPDATSAPTVTAAPTVTTTPDATSTPTVTAAPTVTTTPDATSTPTVTATPTVTLTPNVTAVPDVTDAPNTTASPNMTNVPDITASPNETDIPKQALYYGDVDVSGDISAGDALSILRHVVKLSLLEEGLPQTLADANHDGAISAADALIVLQVVVKLGSAEPYTQP